MLLNRPSLGKAFAPLGDFKPTSGYKLLPFRFTRLKGETVVMTNFVGEHFVTTSDRLRDFVDHKLPREDAAYSELKSRHFLYDTDFAVPLDLLAAKYRTQKANLPDFTALHIFVVTLRCDHSCQYCQVSRVSEDRKAFDMTSAVAERAIDLMLESPSPSLKVEFQGGESLLNFELIRFIVERTESTKDERNVQFVIATNLANLSDEILAFAKDHRIYFSCSLDGPKELHNSNRPRPGRDSYELTVAGIKRVREALGREAVSALMTTTARTLENPRAVIDEYVAQGFQSIFLRWISPYGFAKRTERAIGYETDRYIEFYKTGLDYILDLNLQGTALREDYASIILHKLFSPFAHGYVDLQSPSGLGVSVLVYNYDGDVYASDEGRMLAEMGDKTFRLGNVFENTHEQLFFESPVLGFGLNSMLEGLPGCSDCAFLPYCGADPVFHHSTQGDIVGSKPMSAFCQRNMAIMRHLFEILNAGGDKAKVLRSWA